MVSLLAGIGLIAYGLRLLTTSKLAPSPEASVRNLPRDASHHIDFAVFTTQPVGAASTSGVTLETLPFDNLSLRALPLDPVLRNKVRTVADACFSRVTPVPLQSPKLVATSAGALQLLGLGASEIARPEFVEYVSGDAVLPGAEPAAHCYCGHQFGNFVGQLGDGTVMYLGEIVNEGGERWELQLKGSGRTPYSRKSDGRKVLRSSIREFLCSEASFYLGIPTSRAGSVVTSESLVVRDVQYTGDPVAENCAIVTRIAPTFLRFGSFEIFKKRDPQTGQEGPSPGNYELQRQLLDHVMNTYFADVVAREVPGGDGAASTGDVKVDMERTIEASLRQCGVYLYDLSWVNDRIEVIVSTHPPQHAPEGPDSEVLEQAIRAVREQLWASPQMEAMMEKYELSIATPGASDVLRTDKEFVAWKGFPVVVTTTQPHKKKTKFEGNLVRRDDEFVHLNLKGRPIKVPRELVAEVSLPPPKYEKGDSEMGKLKKKWSWRNAGANAGEGGIVESDGTVAEDTAGGDPWDIEYPEADWGEDDHLPATPKGDSAVARYAAVYREIVLRTARLVAQWQCLGFCHGVLNTDNMSILGITIDYGPFGFMEAYDPDHICNGSDDAGRYRYSAQPEICKWNLRKLAEALDPTLPQTVSLPILEAEYDGTFRREYEDRMLQKLGFLAPISREEDLEMLQDLLSVMESTGADWTDTFRALARVGRGDDLDLVEKQIVDNCCSAEAMAKRFERKADVYPLNLFPENAQKFADLAREDPEELSDILQGPAFSDTETGLQEVAAKSALAETLRQQAATMRQLSPADKRSSDQAQWGAWLEAYQARMAREPDAYHSAGHMDGVNPSFVLRNWVCQTVISEAQEGRYEGVQEVMALLERPYADLPPGCRFAGSAAPEWATDLCVTCSS